MGPHSRRERETEELNLDRKLHILALFAEIAATDAAALKDNSSALVLRSGAARRCVSKPAPELVGHAPAFLRLLDHPSKTPCSAWPSGMRLADAPTAKARS